jgi:REP element-mobilizing transposase RayT
MANYGRSLTVTQNVIHVVFSTKGRCKSISAEFQPKVWAYAAGICKKQGIFVHAIGGMEDHARFLMQVPSHGFSQGGWHDQREFVAVGERRRSQVRVAAGLGGI